MSWLPLPAALLAAHVLANVVWIGALLSVALLVGRAPWMADPAEVGGLARRLYERLAVPAFLASFAAGVARVALAPHAYERLRWFHVKLAFVIVLIAVHHVIGARARRVAAGSARAGGGAAALGAVAFVCAAAAVVLAVAKAWP